MNNSTVESNAVFKKFLMYAELRSFIPSEIPSENDG
jgi:hypothetical protein